MGIKSIKAKKRQDKKNDKKLQFTNGSKPAVRIKEDLQDYARVTNVLGQCRFTVCLSETEKECLAVLCGGLFRRAWITKDTIVLISVRDFQTDKVDIIHKYPDDEVKQLIALKELTTNFAIVNQEKGGDDDDMDFYGGDSYDVMAVSNRKVKTEEEMGYNNMDMIMDDDDDEDDDDGNDKDEKARSITTETKPKSSTGKPLLPSTFSFLDLKEKDREDIEDGGDEDDDIEIDFNTI